MASAPQQVISLDRLSGEVADWVREVAALTLPAQVHWCDGSEAEFLQLRQQMVSAASCIARRRRTLRASNT